MRHRFVRPLPLLLTLLVTACATDSTSPRVAEHASEHASSHPHWSYSGDTGPDRWGDLTPEYALARTGTSQSPIDLATTSAAAATGPALSIVWNAAPLSVENNGHTVQVAAGTGGTLTVGSDVYTLEQFHFHAPSEHTKDGKHAPLEVHFVHRDSQGHLAVLGLLFHEGAANAALGVLAAHAPTVKETKSAPAGVTFDPASLLPGSSATWRYSGSLTTPPCTEGVRWLVLQQDAEASREQLAYLAAILGGNSRPPQPLHGRRVELVR